MTDTSYPYACIICGRPAGTCSNPEVCEEAAEADQKESTMTDMHEDEIEALRLTVDAVTMGIVKLTGSVDRDGNLPSDEEAGCARLQKVLNALTGIYGEDTVSEAFGYIIEPY
jgi:hypothetical protein